ncbi:MAG: hypothetical protein GYA02_10750 [Clostridiaceae bacterium]|nr:hypothetical protein [Clostridiaceae bacterium]
MNQLGDGSYRGSYKTDNIVNMEKTIISDASLLELSDKLEIAALVGGQSKRNHQAKQGLHLQFIFSPGLDFFIDKKIKLR